MFTVFNGDARSKRISADWVATRYPQWKKLIDIALNWKYGIEMKKQSETIEFLNFVINNVDNN